MATIREVFVLEDQFSKTLSQFVKTAGDCTVSVKQMRTEANQATAQARVMASAYRSSAASSNATAAAARAHTAQLREQIAAERLVAQQMRNAAAATRELERSQKSAMSITSRFTSALRNMAGAFIGIQAIQTLAAWSDQLVTSNARLRQVTGSAEDAALATNKIYAAAMRSRSSFADMSSSVAKLATLAGNAFGSIDEAIMFVETFNKQMVLSGASATESSAAMYQIVQAMASGRLQGDELHSIFENAPMIAQTIANYLGVSVGEVRELAAQGIITADVVKNAMLGAAEDTNEAFKDMPMTWAQVWTLAQNIAMRALNPLLSAINFLANNIQIIGPVVLGVAAAFTVYAVAAKGAAAAAAVWSAAQTVLNAVMTMNPVGLVIMAIAGLIAAIYAIVAAINKFAGTSISATGFIAGAFFTLGAQVYNMFVVPFMNIFIALGNFISNVFKHPLASVKVLFADMAITIISIIRNVAQAIEDLLNAIPGVEVSVTDAVNNAYWGVRKWKRNIISESGYEEGYELLDPIRLSNAMNSGYTWGSNIEKGVVNFFTGGTGNLSAIGGIDGTGMAGDISDISKGVSSINKAVNMSEEDIASLVDIAERRYVNNINLTSQTPVITINGQNTGNTAADRQNLADTIRDILIEQVASGSTRSTARAF